MFGAAASASLLSAPASSAAQRGPNPIRKVVTMLQNMQTKVTEEGKREEELFDKFMCYCRSSGGDLTASIEAATTKIESVSSDLKGAVERKAQSEAKLEQHQAARSDAKSTMQKADALRAKEAGAFAAYRSEYETNIAAIDKAVGHLESGAAGSFLQSPEGGVLRKLVLDAPSMQEGNRQDLLSLLASGSQYAPQSGEITGLLKQLGDDMRKDLAEAAATEGTSVQNHGELTAAKKKEVSVLQAQIETQSTRIGQLGVSNAEAANDLEDTKEALAADQKFKQQLAQGCDTKAAERDASKKLRAEELVALAETIKVLNDDDALELFGKTLPTPGRTSLLQVSSLDGRRREKAAELVRSSAADSPQIGLIALALQGKKVGFEKVLKMIDNMGALLKQEQSDDDAKKEYCNGQIDQSEDKRKALELSVTDSGKAIDEMKESFESTVGEIKALTAGIKSLDTSVAEATEQRTQENKEHQALIAADTTAKQVLEWAKNRLNKFYSPKLYKAPPKRELTDEEFISRDWVETTTQPLGGIAGTGIGAFFSQVGAHSDSTGAPAPPPETFGPYTKKSQASNGVIAMIDLLVNDLDKEMQESKVEEGSSQKSYEALMAEAQSKRAADSKSVAQLGTKKATTEENLQNERDNKAAATKELLATVEFLQSVHSECDWCLQNHEARKAARSSEIESLANAKAVLSGADYSFVQLQQRRHGRRGLLAKVA